jgi:hypothetical protein
MMTKQRQLVRYWGRKPSELAEEYIGRYPKPNDVVLDNFGGSGIFVKTALEMGRRAIYIDLNPFAKLIAHSTIEGCDAEVFLSEAEKIVSRKLIPVRIDGNRLSSSPKKIFSVKCSCGRDVEVKYVEFSRRYSVNRSWKGESRGLEKRILMDIQRHGLIIHDELVRLYDNLSSMRTSSLIKSLVRKGIVYEEEIPISAMFRQRCKCGRDETTFHSREIWILKEPFESIYWYPKNRLLYKNGTPFLKKRDVESVDEFFTNRSLTLLSAIWKDIAKTKTTADVKRCLCLVFMATLARSSKMCRKSGGTWLVNSYWIPRKFVVKNPYVIFEDAAIRFYNFLKKKGEVSCGNIDDVIDGRADVAFIAADATQTDLPESSVDYAIIDPPHTDEAQFFELSLFYTSWLRKKLSFDNELVVNSHQGKTLKKYLEMLNKTAERVYHALKEGKYFTAVLHEENLEILEQCADAMKRTGFNLVGKDEVGDYTIYTFKKPHRPSVLERLLLNLRRIFQ